ncbi:MAG: glycosyltransferase family 2 protein [Chloroflexota bacterium]
MPSYPGSLRTRRVLEVGTGLVTWALVTLPAWGAAFAPRQLAALLIAFNAYWLYKSLNMAVSAVVGFRRLRAGQKVDWRASGRALSGWNRVHHLVLVPTYKEPPEVLEVMLHHLAEQDFPAKRIAVVLAFEERDPLARERASELTRQFGGRFGNLWVTFHQDRPGELRGKASNLAYAAKWAKRKLVDDGGVRLDDVVVTVCDADSRLHRKYLSALTVGFLTNELRRFRIWQPALMFYSNIWRLPAAARVSAGLYSVWQLSRLVTGYKLVTQSTYSLSLATCDEVGYWDADVIPEDSRMFFKIFFSLGHEREVRVEPIYLPVLADAAEGKTPLSTLANHYRQTRRWAWGVSDIPYVLQQLWDRRQVPLWARARRVGMYIEEHVCWPTHWFLLTVGAHLVGVFGPLQGTIASDLAVVEQSQMLGAWLLSACLPSLAVVIVLDHRLRPPRPDRIGLRDRAVALGAWVVLPLIGLVLTTLPALDSHTRLLLGKYLHYQVTEKLPADGALDRGWAPGETSAGAA